MKPTFTLLTAVLLAMPVAVCGAQSADALQYNRDVRPILSNNCFGCHGPDKADRKAGLRLDVREGPTTPSRSGAVAIVPGVVEDSELIARIVSTDDDEIMPPPDSHKTLTAEQKEILKRWVAEGAPYEQHWAYQPVQPVRVPAAGDFPQVDADLLEWPRNPIDWFVLRGLVRTGLKPSPRAEADVLARRIALDLTGLPPRRDLAQHFEPTRLDDYISAHFSSPHYGERMAVDWLDAARFADTQGYQNDNDQDMHPWRDWVIAAFNQNMPFDRFTIEQLAGDLLPNPTLEQRIATGFHRNHMVNTEGGVIAAEFIAEYTADRVETTATVWMAQTFNCTRCHDHKFDPLTQKDYFSLMAFFNNVNEQGDGKQDTIILPSPEVAARMKPLEEDVSALEGKLASQTIADHDVRAWANRLAKRRLEWQAFEIAEISAPQGKPKIAGDGRAFDLSLVNAERKPVIATLRLPVGKKITALRLECSTEGDGARIGVGKVAVRLADSKILAMTGAIEGLAQKANEADRVLDASAQDYTTLTVLQPGPNKPPVALVWQLTEPWLVREGETAHFNVTVTVAGRETEWRLFYTEAPVDQLVEEATVELASKEVAALTPPESASLRRQYQLALPESKEVRKKITALNGRIDAMRAKLPAAIVMVERQKPKDTFILMRGAYDKPGEQVTAETPAVLPALPPEAPRNRLGLAQWLVSKEHPLTARVTVNRLWQSIFGAGLVRSSEDFGAQGELPSHPELLDWLAGEFMSSGWDIQHLLRLMLTSATYQQSSRLTPALIARDPENRLLARGPRFRLHAEFVRDQALAAAGLLSVRVGGKSVRPYHPQGLYEMVAAGNATYVESKGDDLHRRSLYTYWRRTVPHPAMIAFDAPGREVCAVRRSRSNTPLQALNLMNDPTYIEAARHIAARMIKAGSTVPAQIQHGYLTLLAREASAAELDVLTRAYDRTVTDFTANPKAAHGLLNTGVPIREEGIPLPTLAAMTSIASTLLCLDETITKP